MRPPWPPHQLCDEVKRLPLTVLPSQGKDIVSPSLSGDWVPKKSQVDVMPPGSGKIWEWIVKMQSSFFLSSSWYLNSTFSFLRSEVKLLGSLHHVVSDQVLSKTLLSLLFKLHVPC